MGTCTILWLSAVSRVFGAEQSLLTVLKHLPAERFRSVLVCPADVPGVERDGADMREEAARLGAAVVKAPLERFRRSFAPAALLRSASALRRGTRSLLQIIRREQPDIVCSNGIHAALCGALAARRARVPHIWIVRDWHTPRIVSFLLGRLSARIIAPSRALGEQTPLTRRARSRLTIIPNAIDPEELRPARSTVLQKEFNVPQSALAVGMVAQLLPWKNHALFIRSAALVTGSPDAYFFIIGSDPWNAHPRYGEELRALATRLGVSERIIFTGYRRDIAAVMSSLDVLVLPSSNEPFGRVLIEAMALEIPVVAAAAGGPLEIVADGEDGLLFPAGDSEALAERLNRLLHSEELRRQLGQRGRRTVVQRFNIRTIITKYEELVNEVLRDAGKTTDSSLRSE
jgi:glycosyltransferase involved in cell wall biosynthesis